MALGTPTDWIVYISLSGLMGVTGQFIRAAGGAKKTNDQAAALNVSFGTVFDTPTFLTSLAIGFTAGVLAALGTQPDTISASFLLGIVAAGYAGADFIEAFLKKSLPDMRTAANVSAERVNPNVQTISALVRSSPSVATGVRTVIANSKGYDLDEIEDGKKLSELNFTGPDCIALEAAINLYFFNSLGLAFDRLLEGPNDIKPGHTVRNVISLVESLHPRPRGVMV
ncbi:hypothetical protein QMZ05_05055 [Bradyrhizobium sp. INPA03-11B]|uniref:hypothetical protein n=1 Tax=Bradyrhizobium sp. INPA03-11B TaxID=418598 RepID=UPI00338F2416